MRNNFATMQNFAGILGTQDNQPLGMGNARFHFTRHRASKQSTSEPSWLQNLARNAAAALPDGRFM